MSSSGFRVLYKYRIITPASFDVGHPYSASLDAHFSLANPTSLASFRETGCRAASWKHRDHGPASGLLRLRLRKPLAGYLDLLT